MQYSQLFGKTLRNPPSDAVLISSKLLVQAGFIRESSAGKYYFLPLGWRVHEKIKAIIKEEMDKAGGQEMITPVLHPLELWQETNRTKTTGFELLTIQDHHGSKFALGGTAEEMFVDLVRKFQLSYKDLPFNLYQFSTKFRDEKRPRGGLLRVREFVMKDAYSFDKDAKSFEQSYDLMSKTYKTIFDRLGLKTIIVEADNGYIGGEYCHEFVVESEIGESRFFVTEDANYAVHEDIAAFKLEDKNINEKLQTYKEIKAARGTTMEDGVKFHKLPLWQQIKDFMVVDENGKLTLAVIRGDLEINEIKLKKLIGANQLRHATDEEIRNLGSEPGFISPVGLKGKVAIVGDVSLRTIKNAYGGANALNKDALNINIDRDYQVDIEGDIAMAQPGFLTKDGKHKLVEKRGIEVGNIFQLGYHYTKKMKGADFTNEKGEIKPFYMGCYGIGIGRSMATLVEKFHDERGIIWPKAVAPYQVHLIDIQNKEKGKEIYSKLTQAGIEVLWDDREISAGVKFKDADLIGIPVRLVVSQKTQDKIEWKERQKSETKLMNFSEVIAGLK